MGKKNESLVKAEPQAITVEAHLRDTPPQGPEATPIIDLTLVRSKKYVKSLLEGDAAEVMQLLQNQMTALLLAFNDQMLRWMEVLNSPKSNPLERVEAGEHINNLMGAAARMAETRVKLQVTSGLDKLTQAGLAKPKLYEKEKELTPEEFVAKYKKQMPADSIPVSKNPS